MKVESNKVNTLAGEMAGSAYGELMQSCVMYDADGNLYLAAFTDANDMEQGHLLRIRKGETDFDASYEGYPNADGKLLTIQNLGTVKPLCMHVMMQPVLPSTATATIILSSTSIPEHKNA